MIYSNEQFPFTRTLEDNWMVIRAELEHLDNTAFVPWHETYLYDKGWQVFGLYFKYERLEENCRLCPQTTRLVETIPGLKTAGFSALAGDTLIRPHLGYTSSVARAHLGLKIPGDCGIRIDGVTRHWEEGKSFVFDDTYVHEAWNNSPDIRIVLLLDVMKKVYLGNLVTLRDMFGAWVREKRLNLNNQLRDKYGVK